MLGIASWLFDPAAKMAVLKPAPSLGHRQTDSKAGLGHLAHEQDPAGTVSFILNCCGI